MRARILTYCCLLAIIIFFIGCENIKKATAKNDNWIQLFNGENLDDWLVKIKGYPLNYNYKNTFRVSNNMLQVNYDEYETFDNSFGHIFYKNEFSNYKLRLEYKFIGKQLNGGASWAKRNSGVMIHCQKPETMALEQNFPVSVEVQLLGGIGEGERSTGNVCTPGTHIFLKGDIVESHCVSSNSKTFSGDQWVKLEILVMNDSIISHKINGEKVIAYYKPQIGGEVDFDKQYWKEKEGNPLKKGYISLQSESHPVAFRKIELLELN